LSDIIWTSQDTCMAESKGSVSRLVWRWMRKCAGCQANLTSQQSLKDYKISHQVQILRRHPSQFELRSLWNLNPSPYLVISKWNKSKKILNCQFFHNENCLLFTKCTSWVWWHKSVILALRQEDHQVWDSLVSYRVSSRPAWTIYKVLSQTKKPSK
jgi:hypothetical protein